MFDCINSSYLCTLAFPPSVANTGLHKLMRGAAEDLDPLVSQITSALDSCSLIVSAATRRKRAQGGSLLVIFNSCD